MFDKNKYLKELEFLVNLNCGTYNKEGVNNIINYLSYSKCILSSDKINL